MFTIPGKKIGLWIVCLLGLIGCVITLLVGFIPPSNINVGSKMYYEFLFCSGLVILTLPVIFFFWYQSRSARAALTSLESEAEVLS